MHRENEYKHLAHNTRKRGCEEQNAQLRAQWEILATTYSSLPISRRRSMTPATLTIRWILREPCGPQVPPKLASTCRPPLRGLNQFHA
jgi:hypothetical protein